MQHHEAVNVLLVDDDDAEAQLVRRAFRESGVSNPIHRARDGAEALAMLRGESADRDAGHPRLVLLDLRMPRMDGIEFLTELRADPEIADTVVFVLTGSSDHKDITAAYERHVAGYVMKSEQGNGFIGLLEMLDAYCRAVELPGPEKATHR